MRKNKASNTKRRVPNSGRTPAVLLFHSKSTDPALVKGYAEWMFCLSDIGIRTEIVNIEKKPELARRYKVSEAPTLLIDLDGKIYRCPGTVDSLKHLLFLVGGLEDLLAKSTYGLSLVEALGFKEGKLIAKKLRLAGSRDRGEIEKKLDAALSKTKIYDIRIEDIDFDKAYAKVQLACTLRNEPNFGLTRSALEKPLLGGIFTAIFGKGVSAKKAAGQKNLFKIKEATGEFQEKADELVRRAIKPVARTAKPQENALSLLLTIDPKNYSAGIVRALEPLREKGATGIYITMNMPYLAIQKLLGKKGFDTQRIFFIDAISKPLGGARQARNVAYVQGPQDLKDLITEAIEAMNALPGQNKFLVLDSLISLLIYNSPADALEFLTELIREAKRLKYKILLTTIRASKDPTETFYDKYIRAKVWERLEMLIDEFKELK